MIVETEGLTGQGEAIARAPDGRIMFVRGAVPHEQVRVETVGHAKRFIRARALEVLRPGPDRVTPECPHAEVCGGCSLQHLAPEAQTHFKEAAAVETLRRLGDVDLESMEREAPWSGPAYGYRSRARWHRRPGVLGYRQARSAAIVDVVRCPVLVEPLERALAGVRRGLPDSGSGEVWASAYGGAIQVWGSEGLEASGFAVIPPGEAVAEEDAAGPVWLGPATFAQANRAGNDALLQTFAAWLEPFESALELYSGSGNFTRVLARRGDVVAAEGEAAAVRLAERVAGPRTSLWTCSGLVAVRRALHENLAVDCVCVDPPRSGLERELARLIVELEPAFMLYISCDPATLARDARLLGPEYRLTRLRAFDLFPQTPHLELMARFDRTTPP